MSRRYSHTCPTGWLSGLGLSFIASLLNEGIFLKVPSFNIRVRRIIPSIPYLLRDNFFTFVTRTSITLFFSIFQRPSISGEVAAETSRRLRCCRNGLPELNLRRCPLPQGMCVVAAWKRNFDQDIELVQALAFLSPSGLSPWASRESSGFAMKMLC